VFRIRTVTFFCTDPDPEKTLFVSDLQDTKFIFFPKLFMLLLFEGILTSFFPDGSGSVQINYGSRIQKAQNIRILRIRIQNTGYIITIWKNPGQTGGLLSAV
jgi:hypothetical protein